MQEWVGGSPEAPPRVSWCLGARETERPGGENEGESALSHFAPLRFQILTPGNPQQGLRAERLGGPRRLERTGPGWGGRDRRRTARRRIAQRPGAAASPGTQDLGPLGSPCTRLSNPFYFTVIASDWLSQCPPPLWFSKARTSGF